MGQDARPQNAAARGPICARAAAALKLWSDPKIWLLSGSNITFGFSAAYLGGYINANWQHEALKSDDFIGFLGAIICLIATISSKVYGVVAEKNGHQNANSRRWLSLLPWNCIVEFRPAPLSR